MPTERPIVLIHGMSAGPFAWNPVLPQLSGHEVVNLTLPGHLGGAVVTDERAFDTEVMVDGVDTQQDARGITQAHLVGNSIGGWMALKLAARGRASSVVCFAPAGGWDSHSLYSRWLAAEFRLAYRMSRRLNRLSDEEILASRVTRALLTGMVAKPEQMDAADTVAAVRATAGCEALRVMLARPDASVLRPPGEVPCPVLVAWSGKDRILTSAKARAQVLSWVPQATEVVLPGVGHVPMSDEPEVVAARILQFVTATGLSTSA